MKDNKLEWEFIVDRSYTPLAFSLNIHVNNRTYLSKYVDIKSSDNDGLLFIPNDIYWSKDSIADTVEAQVKIHKERGNSYLWEMAETCQREGEQLLEKFEYILEPSKIATLNREGVLNLFTESVGLFLDFSPFIVIPWVLEDYLEKKLRDVIDFSSTKDTDDVFAKLLLPIKTNASVKEPIELLKLAVTVVGDEPLNTIFNESGADEVLKTLESKESSFLQDIDDFIETYKWVHIRWFKGGALHRRDVISRIQKILQSETNPKEELSNIEERNKRTEKFANVFVKKNGLDKNQADTIFLVKEYVFLRTYRTDVQNRALALMRPLIDRIAEILSISIDDCLYYSEAELKDLLQGKEISIDINERKKNWAILRIKNEYKIYTGASEVKRLAEFQGVSRDVTDLEKITGQTAFPGKVSGVVKIVLDPTDVSKVQEGDVLVSVMTFPSYITAMEKAAAFVTDEGGILCHASIIAREMKKPCVIATKTATQVLKDGDLVEIDADDGVVRVVERADN